MEEGRARKKEASAESGRAASGAPGCGCGWGDAILSLSRCWTPIFFFFLGLFRLAVRSTRVLFVSWWR